MDKIKRFYVVLSQFVKFGIVGLSNNMVSLGIYYILIFFNINYLIANTIGFFASIINSYYWNKKYVFKPDNNVSSSKSFIKVTISYGISYILSIIIMYMFVDIMNISENIAPVLKLVFTVPINFLLNKLWAFK